jgi:hypothetical protein
MHRTLIFVGTGSVKERPSPALAAISMGMHIEDTAIPQCFLCE